MTDEKHKNKQFWLKLIISALLINSLIWLIVQKSTHPELSLTVPFWISVVLLIGFLGVFFGKKIVEGIKKSTTESNLQKEPMSIEEINKRIDDLIANEGFYPERGFNRRILPYNQLNGNVIYEVHEKLHDEAIINGNRTDEIIILINATNRKLKEAVMTENTPPEIIKERAFALAGLNLRPDKEKIVTRVDKFGESVREEEREKYPREEKKEEGAVA